MIPQNDMNENVIYSVAVILKEVLLTEDPFAAQGTDQDKRSAN